MSPIASLLVGVVVVLAITAATAYFVAQEFAFVAVDRSKLASRVASGDQRAAATLDITRRTSFMLSGAQLGITVTGLLVGYVAEPLIGQAVGSMLSGGALTAVSVAIGAFVALAFSTLVQMLFGELFPKNYAIARPGPVADALAPSTRLYLWVLHPVIWVFDKAAELLLRLAKIEPVHDVESAVTVADLERVVADSRAAGTLSDEVGLVIDRIIDFPRRDVEHAMVPRVRVDTVPETATIAEVRAEMATGHTRYPIIAENNDVLGIVELSDVLDHPADSWASVTTIARAALFLPSIMKLPDAQAALRDAGKDMACVLDEFGGFTGVVTVEDLVEEIVGDLVDEHDLDPEPEDDSHVVDGAMPLDDVERLIAHRLPEGDYETLAGLLIHEKGDLPALGEVISLRIEPTLGELTLHSDAPSVVATFEVQEIERHVPSRVRIEVDTETPEVKA
ncbi:Hemolysin, contains CBS domains [Tessaracoccus bendigoensis DSM 12906]|uniref:Hemolysin, contains CBS domains n=1 Tax=Tessaracoccus bendigoensis DSM 12906 TaxID=1123357 RepID=A0A1M6E4M1_9ACTN|nr:hemolysin family protein [Tessaracoccus bendigoensis]SHI80484.1 Hemolysin, contains CBS domains [Tessaracoccus bendigoensis DSM 12906]